MLKETRGTVAGKGIKKRKSRLEARAAFLGNAVAVSNGMGSLCTSRVNYNPLSNRVAMTHRLM